MIKKIQAFIKAQGYELLQAEHGESAVCYMERYGRPEVIFLLDGTGEMEINPMLLEQMIAGVKGLFLNPMKRPPHLSQDCRVEELKLLTILCSPYQQELEVSCANVENVWGINVKSGKLIGQKEKDLDTARLWDDLEKYLNQLAAKGLLFEEEQKEESLLSKCKKWWVTAGVILINILVYIVMELLGDTQDAEYMMRYGANSVSLTLDQGEYWRLFTCVFMHFGIVHLLNNMFILAVVGSRVEEALGHVRFLILYLLSGLSASAISLLSMYLQQEATVSAGASGAVFGAFGALLAIVLVHRGKYEGLTIRSMVFMIALSLYLGIASAGVDNWAHFGGVIGGFIFCLFLYHPKID